MSKLKQGDRVRIYGNSHAGQLQFGLAGEIGTLITDPRGTGFTDVRVEEGPTKGRAFTFHAKQLRKIKPRKRIFVKQSDMDRLFAQGPATGVSTIIEKTDQGLVCNYIEFVEVKKKK